MEGLLEGGGQAQVQLRAVNHLKLPVLPVKGQVLKASGAGNIPQGDPRDGGVLGALGRHGVHQLGDLAQPQLHGGAEVGGHLLADTGHVDDADLRQRVRAHAAVPERLDAENKHTKNGKQHQAGHQKPCDFILHGGLSSQMAGCQAVRKWYVFPKADQYIVHYITIAVVVQ